MSNQVAATNRASAQRPVFFPSVLLGLLVVVAYLPALSAEFVRLDDHQYVVDNAAVRNPGANSLRRFFFEMTNPSTVSGYYQPLTMTSLMFDAWLNGRERIDPFIFHLTNIALHAVAAILVLFVVRSTTGGIVVPWIAAAVFALHPVQVESVAWISQRKTVLASALAIGSILCYLRHGRGASRAWLGASAALFALAGLAKPTVVMLPLVLPLLDHWPLRRRVVRSLIEKWPFALIMAAMAGVAWTSQAESTAALAMPDLLRPGTWPRLTALACHNMALYLGNVFWPASLSPYRAIPANLSPQNPAILASVAGAIGLGLVCVFARRRVRPVFVGLAGFFVLLLPALGMIRFSETCVADRFLYLPILFLILPAAWFVRRLERARPARAHVVQLGAILLLIPLGLLTRAQQRVWKDSRALWTHVAAAVPTLAKAQYELAVLDVFDRAYDVALLHVERAVEAEPRNADYCRVLGVAYTGAGRPLDAIPIIERALSLGLGPRRPWGYVALADAHIAKGDAESAQAAMRETDALYPSASTKYAWFAGVAMSHGKYAIAVDFYRRALEHGPVSGQARWSFGAALEATGKPAEALEQYEQVLRDAEIRISDEMRAAYDRLRRDSTTTAPAEMRRRK
ncbi:MAG: tetratricopeptide repeat protein [Phycisphaerae bacterium]